MAFCKVIVRQIDGVLVIMKNGYTSATGARTSTVGNGPLQPSIERTLKSVGIRWLRRV